MFTVGIMRPYIVKLFIFIACAALGGNSLRAQALPTAENIPPDPGGFASPRSAELPDTRGTGSIAGTVVDQSGSVIAGARLKLTVENQSGSLALEAGEAGEFSFSNIVAGTFHLTVASPGFATQTFSGVLRSGEAYTFPPIVLVVAVAFGEVQVVPTHEEVAQDEIKAEEHQRALGFIPNFYVSYEPDAVSLSARQKFGLAWKTVIDPVNFGINAITAGLQQSQDQFSGYGQGTSGYAKRYGASYADFVTATYIGSAILPSILKQDPRYFYKGTGTKKSRALYAMANAFICKGDNGHWQPNYSSMMGSFAAAGLSNLYYPSKDSGARLTVENALIDIGSVAAANLLQEFLIRKLTPNLPHRSSTDKSPSTVSKLLNSFDRDGG